MKGNFARYKIIPYVVILSIVAPICTIFFFKILSVKSDYKVGFTEYGPLTDTILQFMYGSNSFLYVSSLDVSHPEILNALISLQKNGIDVRVLTEKPVTNINSKIDISKGLHHVKFMVNDNGVVFGSANFSKSGLESGLNDMIFFSVQYVERFKEFFLKAWDYGTIVKVKDFQVSPVDKTEEFVLKTIQNAKKRVWICAYAFTDSNLLASLKYKESTGVDVRLVTDKWFLSSPLLKYKPHNSVIVSSRMLHHKFIIVDSLLITGSTNYTESGFHRNVEMMWSTKNKYILKRYETVFLELYNEKAHGRW
ncbi:MAG: phospholipase D-like domain-containing protein [Fervidobacterium sp.]|uniref:phospholipase D n=1 Tax=Fervidobacterium gondwanense DSM 13020 TaxID=1121883 RepID=A0A1M7T5D6_FERGO|nr:phospholipase D-like domain-containing protein [Fervidobacterium gondwanense]SHN65917.1 Phosphatidylserine/phosphatidylglycerophosphate/cardiolipin synthase [Fervidobacterium gondwanense DSM 13020]